jgi:hypothetical protein
MDFSIEGPNGSIKIELEKVFGYPNQTSHSGGYDTKSRLYLTSRGFSVNSDLWLSTGEIYNFYQSLQEAHAKLSGSTRFTHSEHNLWFTIEYDFTGHILVSGEFRENHEENNLLKFEVSSDQSYIDKALTDLKRIVMKYGDNTGNASSTSDL